MVSSSSENANTFPNYQMDPNDIITMLNFAQKKSSDDSRQSFGSEKENSAIKQILNLVQDVRYNQDNQVYKIVLSDSQHFHYSRKKRFVSNVIDHLPWSTIASFSPVSHFQGAVDFHASRAFVNIKIPF